MLSGDDGPTLMLDPRHDMAEGKHFGACDQHLQGWNLNLPMMCMYDSISALSACESPVTMMYHTVEAALYTPQIMPFSPWSAQTSSVVEAANSLPEISRTKIRVAAEETSGIGNDLQKLGLLHYLPTSSVTAFLPALIIHLMHIAYARKEQVAQSMQHFSIGMTILITLSDNYASAELAVHFLESTINLSQMRISGVTRLLHQSPQSEPRSRSQITDNPNVHGPPPDESWRSRSRCLVDTVHSKEDHFSVAAPMIIGHLWPEWSLWLDGGPLDSGFADTILPESSGPRPDIPWKSRPEGLDLHPISDGINSSTRDMPGITLDNEHDVLQGETDLRNSEFSPNSTYLGPEIALPLNSDTFFFPDEPYSEGMCSAAFTHGDLFHYPDR
ncbi:C6 transcription factor [Penicillium frequentans]|uniref:C6 transcription factor n=1 Tax=Penicillium frequentans TaxID=3151616 RepID=A0AAD6CLK8_9EURO|nr:C6 transcription factor [Penicillium glabrum]